MIAIPAIDLMNGACVRLRKGRFDKQTIYDKSPLDVARAIEETGISHLHLVDLDGAKSGEPANLRVLETLARETALQIDYGGGIRNIETIRRAIEAGATKINLGTFLFSDPDVPAACTETFGKERLIAAIDIVNGMVAIKGWQQSSGMKASKAIEDLLDIGWHYFSVTDISRDGTMEGPDPGFYKPLVSSYPSAKFIGGGGVASVKHLHLLKSCGLYAAITGKALFEGKISLQDLAAVNSLSKRSNPYNF